MILNLDTVLYKNCKGPICSLASVYKPSFTIFLTFCTKHGELKLTTKPFAGRTLRGLLLAKFGHAQKAKFREFLGLKVTQQSWLLLFAFSPPLFFRFSCLIFFSLAGHLVGFILVGRVFRKAFRILGLGERKGRWVMEQDFHGDFQVLVTWFFASFSGVLDWIVLILVWFERSLHSAHVSGQSCPWPLKLMTSQAEKRRGSERAAQGRKG